MQTIDDWNARYAEHEKALNAPATRGYPFEYKMNYPIRIKQARVEKSQRGDVQLAMDLEILDSEGKSVAQVKEWQQLPKQASDNTLPVETVLKLTQMRRDNIGQILASVEHSFLPYKEIHDTKDKRSFTDEHGKEIPREELKQRTVETNASILKACDELHGREGETIAELDGAELYLVKSENKKNEQYPYSSFHHAPAFKLATFTGDE